MFCMVGQEIVGITSTSGLGVQNETGQQPEHTGQSKYPFPMTQEMSLPRDITRWSTPKSD